MTVVAAGARPRYRTQTPQHRIARVVAALVGVGMIAGGVLLMVYNVQVASVDTVVSSWLTQFVGIGGVLALPESQVLLWQIGTPDTFGLHVSAECTSAFLVGPGAILGGLLLVTGRFGVGRVVLAFLAASVVMVAANWTRLTLIAWATANWGLANGYQWSHTVVGSLIALFGVLLGIVSAVLVLVRNRAGR